MLGAGLLLIPIYQSFFVNVGQGHAGLINPDLASVWPRMQTAFMVGFAPFPWVAVVLLLAMAVRVAWRTTVPWILTAGVFFGVELLTQAQVRYIYTVAPLMATGLAAVLVPLWRKGWAGRMLVGLCIGFVAWVSFSLWADAILSLQKPRIDGLTH